MVEAAGLALWSWNVSSDDILLNEAAAELWCLPWREVFSLATLVGCIRPEDRHYFDIKPVHGREAPTVVAFDVHVVCGASLRRLSMRGRADPSAAPDVVIVGILTDVTVFEAAKAVAAETRLAGDLLHMIIEAVPALIYVKDRSGRMQIANKPVMEAVGRAWEEIDGRTDAEFLRDATQAVPIMATDQRVMDSGEMEEIEEVVGYDEYGPRVFLSQKTALRGADGLAMGLIGTSIDITARKRSEQRSAASEMQLRRLIDSMFAFVGVVDLDGILIEANRAPVEGAGLRFEDVLGRPFCDAYWWSHDPATRDRIVAAVDKARMGQMSRFDVEIRWRDDRRITIDFQLAPVLDGAGRVIQLIPSGVDVTARHIAEAQRETLILELDHRVKNLFMIASSMVAMSARRARTPVELAEAVTGRLTALAYAHSLIGPAIRGTPQEQEADLAELIMAIVAPHLDSLREDQLEMTGLPLPVTGAVPGALALVLHELATNAVKYGALSVPDGRLRISWSERDGRLVLVWTESGGPGVTSHPATYGFGTKLIRSTVSGQLGGTIGYEWLPTGLRITLIAAIDRLHAQ